MTLSDYVAQEEKIRNIANQDISMFEKDADFNKRESLLEIIEQCEIYIKKYLNL